LHVIGEEEDVAGCLVEVVGAEDVVRLGRDYLFALVELDHSPRSTLADAPDKEVLSVAHRAPRDPDLTELRDTPRACY
jgi:hypothetical protein